MIADIFGWGCFICLGLAFMMEPKEPPKDRRFKTGYKNNVKMPIKSQETKDAQKFLIIIGAIAGVIWYFTK